MTHEEKTVSLWNEVGRLEWVYEQWASFFCSMIGRPDQASALCELGMKVVRGEVLPDRGARRRVARILVRNEGETPHAA